MENKNVNFKELEEKGIYPQELLLQLKRRNYSYLNSELTNTQKNDKEFMEPLLYAVKKEYKTYEVYTHYGKSLKENFMLVKEIVRNNEPELIKDTSISDNKEYILDLVEINPKVVLYMSNNLQADNKFKAQLLDLDNKGINICVKLIENPQLANNIEFMKDAVKFDVSFLGQIGDELKNNYEFIKDASRENYEVVNYIINHEENFGLEAISGAKDTTQELTIEDSMKTINEEAKTNVDKRYQKVVNKVNEKGKKDVRAVRWVTAMAAQSDKVTPEYFKKVFDDSTLAMLSIKKDLTQDGKEKVSVENMQKMVTPQILNKLKEKAIEQGLEVDIELENKIEEYTKYFYNYRERLNEEKRKNLEKNKQQNSPKDIERLTGGVQLSGIAEEPKSIRNVVENERKRTDDKKRRRNRRLNK